MLMEVADHTADVPLLTRRTVVGVGFDEALVASLENVRDMGAETYLADPALAEGGAGRTHGFDTLSVGDAVADAQVLVIGAAGASVVTAEVARRLTSGSLVLITDPTAVKVIEPLLPNSVDIAFASPLVTPTELRTAHINGRAVQGLGAVHRDLTGEAGDLTVAWVAAVCGTGSGSLVAAEGHAADAIIAARAVLHTSLSTAVASLTQALTARGCPAAMARSAWKAALPSVAEELLAAEEGTPLPMVQVGEHQSEMQQVLAQTLTTLPLSPAIRQTVCPDVATLSSTSPAYPA